MGCISHEKEPFTRTCLTCVKQKQLNSRQDFSLDVTTYRGKFLLLFSADMHLHFLFGSILKDYSNLLYVVNRCCLDFNCFINN